MFKPLSDSQRSSLESAVAEYETNLPQLLPYLEGRGISRATAESHRLGLVGTSPTSQYAGRLAIPYLTTRGVAGLRFRCLADHDCKELGCSKYLGFPGVPTRLFNTRVLPDAGDVIFVTEGEMDAISLTEVGLPAVGVPGAANWKDHYPRVFGGFSRVVLVSDGDGAGDEFAARVGRSLPSVVNARIGEADGGDVNAALTKVGRDGLRRLLGV